MMLADELFGHDAPTFVATWEEQRWGPQYPDLGIEATAAPPATLCKKGKANRKVVGTLMDHVKAYAAMFPPSMDGIAMRYEVGNLLDRLATVLVRKFAEKLKGAGVDDSMKLDAPSVMAYLVRSFRGCEEAPHQEL
eukprot:gnl/TRDRNA2_/TRDRNA2_171296_c1_seq2.p1 gnl/TRDRNA2_/TRDRNA2_171296_c1~~gnl/TRDRNA2_/TRDRNA2_171296_c1_seq2.p1  ORF type:complete len:136 (+),score=16.46 gnl/TRDRNA2_/TRDRNA2_171296_c1_seq2:110-517(+)